MKAEAYVCDYCQQLKFSAETVGINPTADMFSRMDSYPTIMNPARADIHYCVTCYNLHVVSVAERETNRKKDEKAYMLKLKEMHYNLKSQCIANYNMNMRKKVAHVRKK